VLAMILDYKGWEDPRLASKDQDANLGHPQPGVGLRAARRL
jgi:hypothetical protein